MAVVRFLPPAARYFKKLKDKQLKRLYQEAIDLIADDPAIGEEKTGDLRGVRGTCNCCCRYYSKRSAFFDADRLLLILVSLC